MPFRRGRVSAKRVEGALPFVDVIAAFVAFPRIGSRIGDARRKPGDSGGTPA
jgi:hypothetical protein